MLSLRLRSTLRWLQVALIATLTLALASPAAAISDQLLYQNYLNGVYYYNRDGSLSSSCVSTGNNLNYAGVQVWTDGEMALIEANQPFYEEAATKYGIAWQFLAVIHSMESGLSRTNPYQSDGSAGEGVYQLHSIKYQHTALFQSGKVLTDQEFREQTDLAANVLANDNDLTTDGGVKRAFFKYNGTAGVYIEKALNLGFSQEEANNGEGSYYVMNRYDARRDPASPEMSPLWPGRFVADGVYDPSSTSLTFGAYTKYAALGGGSGVCKPGNGDINSTALELAWPEGGHSLTDPTPAYKQALQSVGLSTYGDQWVNIGASCDAFVATVMRYSGVDPDFPCCGIGGTDTGEGQYNYLATHPERYQHVGVADNSANAQPGDIRIKAHNHIELVVQLPDGTIAIASASHGERTAEVSNWYNDSSYDIFRHI